MYIKLHLIFGGIWWTNIVAKGWVFQCRFLNQKYDDAIAGYRDALQLDPNNSAAREGLARAQKAKAAEDALR